MINLNIDINLPFLWGDKHFIRNEWGNINYIVGPNGTGKSLLAEKIKANIINFHKKEVKLLNSERLYGLEKNNYSFFGSSVLQQGFNISNFDNYKSHGDSYNLSTSAFVLLKEKLHLKIRIESILTDIFNKTIHLVEEGGYLIPKIQNILKGNEYLLSSGECHGLKEIITLLTFIYDDKYNVLILDEPELHLHPQFQSFILEEIRKVSGDPFTDPTKKMIFIVTHSPYFLDFKIFDDLKNILVCRYDDIPTYINELDDEYDKTILQKFIPRFNTHHKQFFFSKNPVFVEGYTDQQLFSLLMDKANNNIGASGTSIIDVGGKEELAVFYKFCKNLGIESRIICDLDVIFKGRLIQYVNNEEKCKNHINSKGLGEDLSQYIGDFKILLSEIAESISALKSAKDNIENLQKRIIELNENKDNVDKVRLLTLLCINWFEAELLDQMVADKPKLDRAKGMFENIIQALIECHVYILKKGEIEHYYKETDIDIFNITDNDISFHKERDLILCSHDLSELKLKYKDLYDLLDVAVPNININFEKQLRFEIIEFIQNVQKAIERGEVNNIDTLKLNARINYKLYNQILEVIEISIKENFQFDLTFKTKNNILDLDKEYTINQSTTANNFQI